MLSTALKRNSEVNKFGYCPSKAGNNVIPLSSCRRSCNLQLKICALTLLCAAGRTIRLSCAVYPNLTSLKTAHHDTQQSCGLEEEKGINNLTKLTDESLE
jgi:hypothetical protein